MTRIVKGQGETVEEYNDQDNEALGLCVSIVSSSLSSQCQLVVGGKVGDLHFLGGNFSKM
jgi:hypothetical protein